MPANPFLEIDNGGYLQLDGSNGYLHLDQSDPPSPGGFGSGVSKKTTSFNWPGHKASDSNINKPILQLGE